MSAPAQLYLYDAQGADSEVALEAGMLERLADKTLLWIDLPGPDAAQFADVVGKLGLDARLPAALRDPGSQFRVANYGAYQHFPVCVPAPDGKDRPPVRLDFVVGENWLLTAHDGRVGFLREFRDQDRGETMTGALSGAAFAASLLDWHLETYFREVAGIEDEIDALDDRILEDASDDALLASILHVRRRVSRLRRLLADQRPVFYGLERPDMVAGPTGDSGDIISRLAARYERALDEIERTRDLILGSFDLLTSRVSQQTNDLVKALTFFTGVIGTVAAIAGLFGMNFDPPFFNSGSTGFFAVVAGLTILAAIAFVWARHRRWL